MDEYERRILAANGTDFIFADGWRKCFASCPGVVTDDAAARGFVQALLADLASAKYLRTQHIPAWEIDAHRFEFVDGTGRRWNVSLFVDDGNTVVHKVVPVP